MGFSAKQVQALRRNLDRRHVRTREANGRELSYIEGWYAISEANRIFGFDGWNRETVDSRCVLTRENRGTFLAVYIAKVRITVKAGAQPPFAKAMAPAKVAAPRLVKSMTLRSRLQKPMPPNERLPPSVSRLGWSFIAKKTAPATVARARSRRPAATELVSPRRYDSDPAAVALLWPSAGSL